MYLNCRPAAKAADDFVVELLALFGDGVQRIHDTDHAVARNERGQIGFRPVFGALWTKRQDQIPDIRCAVMHSDFAVVGAIEAELAHDTAWVNHCPLSVIETLVPVGRSPQDRSRITGTQSTD